MGSSQQSSTPRRAYLRLRKYNERAAMSFDSYTQHMPTLQRTTFWSNYMSGLKGNLSAVERPAEIREVSPFTQYRAVDVTMYDLIYGSHRSPAHTMSGYEFYKPLHTDILGRGRGSSLWAEGSIVTC